MTVSIAGWERVPAARGVIEAGRAEGIHIGAQLYVSLNRQVVADCALGESRAGVPMTPDTLMIWFSSTKPVTAVALAQQWERGRCSPDDPVCQHLPEFAAEGKERVTLRHLLTHTGGFRFADGFGTRHGPFAVSWDENVARVCAAQLEPGWVPGQKAGYHPTSSMFIIGEIVRRCDGRPFARYVREEIFQPLGMHDSWIGMPPERYRAYGDRIGWMHATEKGGAKPLPVTDSEEGTARCIPGGNGRGPMRELGWFYEALLGHGARNGVRIVSPQTVAALTARHRVGMHDATLGLVVDWGLGFAIDTVSYGRHASARTYGHGGAQSSVGLADPEYGLVVALVTNGMPGRERHYRRFEAVCSALYEDLALVPPGSAGRSHPMPVTALT